MQKKRNSDRELWRQSWGSAHSQSSCSIHSTNVAAGNGLGGKDDFWAALQTNYNYIMDTNLLDTCKEARGELEQSAGDTAVNSGAVASGDDDSCDGDDCVKVLYAMQMRTSKVLNPLSCNDGARRRNMY